MTVKEIQQYVVDYLNSGMLMKDYKELAQNIGIVHDGERWKRQSGKKNGDTFIIDMPTEQQFINYWEFYGYKTDVAKKVYWIYRNNNWRDSRNKPIVNWKTKCQFVWFEPKNKAIQEVDNSIISTNIHANSVVKERIDQKYK